MRYSLLFFAILAIAGCNSSTDSPVTPPPSGSNTVYEAPLLDSVLVNGTLDDSIQVNWDFSGADSMRISFDYEFFGQGGSTEISFLLHRINSGSSYYMSLSSGNFPIPSAGSAEYVRSTTNIVSPNWFRKIYTRTFSAGSYTLVIRNFKIVKF